VTGSKWWEVVPSGATFRNIDPMTGSATVTFGTTELCIDLFADTVVSMTTDTENTDDGSIESWRKAVSLNNTTKSAKEWAAFYERKYVCAVGKIDVYVYADPKTFQVVKVVADDLSLSSVDDMRLCYANGDFTTLYGKMADRDEHAIRNIITGETISGDWPAWDFTW
jgi:hypothetical protein